MKTASVLLKMQQVQRRNREVHFAQRLCHWVMDVALWRQAVLRPVGQQLCSKQLTHESHTFVSATSRLGSADGASMLMGGISCNSHLQP